MFKQSIKKILKFFLMTINKIKPINLLLFNTENDHRFDEHFNICNTSALNVSRERFAALYQSVNYNL